MLCLHTNLPPKNCLCTTQLPHQLRAGATQLCLKKELSSLEIRVVTIYCLLDQQQLQGPSQTEAESTQNTQVAAVYSAHAVTSLTCSWLSPVASSHTLVHLHAILCGSKHTCGGHYLGISQSTEKKKTSNIS